MVEWICSVLESLNRFAGLFSLLAVIAAVVVPIVIYKIQLRNERKDAIDELNAMNDVSRFPMTSDQREYYTKKSKLEKRLKRK